MLSSPNPTIYELIETDETFDRGSEPEPRITWYWEHLGMLRDAEYDSKRKAKLKWYEQNGILPGETGGGPNGTLLTTTELDGIDHPQIAARIKKIKTGG